MGGIRSPSRHSSVGDRGFACHYDGAVSRARWVLVIFFGFVVGACVSDAVPDKSGPSSNPTAPDEARESPSKELLDHAIELRQLLGLRADRHFVDALFMDAAAVERGVQSAYGIPLTAPELEQLATQQRAVDATIAVVERYAATVPDAWAGLYIDSATRDVVAQFKRPIGAHQDALQPLLTANAPLRLNEVDWSFVELERLRDTVQADLDWLAEVDATFLGLGVDELGNRVKLTVRSARPDIVKVIGARYGESPMLKVELDPRAPWTGGNGTVVVTARYDDGRPVEDHDCWVAPIDPAAGPEDIRSTGDEGRCIFPSVPATSIRVWLTPAGNPESVIAADKATVAEGEVTTVHITIHR